MFILFLIVFATTNIKAQQNILPGAYQTSKYFPLLKNKRVGLFTNQTAIVGKSHLIDTLLKDRHSNSFIVWKKECTS